MRAELQAALNEEGLILRGVFAPQAEESLPLLPGGGAVRSVALVGNAGSGIWRAFRDSPERADGLGDSLDRWTKRVLDGVAARFSALALFPFEGPPYFPFQRWAQRAEPVFSSPLGILIHPEYGLWHAYRGALLLPSEIEGAPMPGAVSPCESCRERPCLTHCPVDAFGERGYDVAACVGHIASRQGAACLEGGCKAREACPVGAAYRYEPEHKAFHMAAFLKARLKEDKIP